MIKYRKNQKNFTNSDLKYIKSKKSEKSNYHIKLEKKIDEFLKKKGILEIFPKEEGIINLKKIISDSRDTLCSSEKNRGSHLSLNILDFSKNPLFIKRKNFMSYKKL